MDRCHIPSRKPRTLGFTLVELLVVIGIIALLIGILLPSLAKARQQAETVKCAANLRSIGQALMIYVNNSKGVLPYSYWNGNQNMFTYTANNRSGDWTTLLANALDSRQPVDYQDAKTYSARYPGSRGIFVCPTAIVPTVPGYLTDYTAHPRLLPSLSLGDYDYNDNKNGTPNGFNVFCFAPPNIARIRRAADLATIFDGSISNDNGGTGAPGQWAANVTGSQLDQGRIYWDDWLTTDQSHSADPTGNYLNSNNSIDTSSNNANGEAGADWNMDVDDNWSNIRFRHGKNNKANVLFLDGHVATFTAKNNHNCDLLRKNVEIDYIRSVMPTNY